MGFGVSRQGSRWDRLVSFPSLVLLSTIAAVATPGSPGCLPCAGSEYSSCSAPAAPVPQLVAAASQEKNPADESKPKEVIGPQTPQTPPKEPGESARPPEGEPQAQAPEPTPESETSAAVGGEGFAAAAPGGYLDNAIPQTMIRLRYDAEYGINRFDRATFMFGGWKELSFHPHGIQGGGAFYDPRARGPIQLPKDTDLEFASTYIEYAFSNRFSAFVTVPFEYVSFHNLQEDHPEGGFPGGELKSSGILPANIRNLPPAARAAAILAAFPNPNNRFFPEQGPENGTQHTTQEGLSDVDFGIKAALIADCDRYLTLQFRTYSPSGHSTEGIGTGHWTEEPSLLYFQRIGKWEIQGQLQDWIPLTNDPVAGNVLNVGVGLGYEVYRRGKLRIVPITEWIMWEVLNGFETVFEPIAATPPPNLILPISHGLESARGVTIVNGKVGVRMYYGDHSDLYVGFGQAVTHERWYDDIFRVEFRYKF